jgi:DNA-binding transcriptional LysR family regulator
MDRLTSMNVFTKVVESGGFSAAGRRLNMSTTMVSNHIQALEEQLGARLLNRTTRKVSVTEIGQTYYERCSQILAEVAEADEAVGELQSTPRGVLRLNISPALPPVIGRIIVEYLGLYPDVSVDMTATDRMVDLVEEGIDLSIRITPVAEQNLIARRLASYRHVVCGSPAYLAKHGTPKVPADLANHNCLHYEYSPFGMEWRFSSGRGEQSVRVSGNLRCNSSITLSDAAILGQGLILMPGFLVTQELRDGRLVSLLTDFLPNEFVINAFYAHRRHLSAKIRIFVDLLIDHFNLNQ